MIKIEGMEKGTNNIFLITIMITVWVIVLSFPVRIKIHKLVEKGRIDDAGGPKVDLQFGWNRFTHDVSLAFWVFLVGVFLTSQCPFVFSRLIFHTDLKNEDYLR
jgi:hypothetical protein